MSETVTTTAPAVLAVNVGSSSLKCALFTHEADPRPIARENLRRRHFVVPPESARLD